MSLATLGCGVSFFTPMTCLVETFVVSLFPFNKLIVLLVRIIDNFIAYRLNLFVFINEQNISIKGDELDGEQVTSALKTSCPPDAATNGFHSPKVRYFVVSNR